VFITTDADLQDATDKLLFVCLKQSGNFITFCLSEIEMGDWVCELGPS
jgi:hypothetical protein